MPLKNVYREAHSVEKVLVSVVCNACGKEETIGSQGYFPHGFHRWQLSGGFGDDFPGDMESFDIIVCEDCLKAWVKTFKHPDVVAPESQGVPYKVTHSETGEEWVVLWNTHLCKSEDDLPEKYATYLPYPEGEPMYEGSIWEHKSGRRYQFVELVWDLELNVYCVYRALYGDSKVWVRPYEMWHEDIEGRPRFVKVSNASR